MEAKSIIDLLSEKAALDPTNVAVSFAETTLTYASLDRRSSELASELVTKGVGLEDRVAVLVKRDLTLVPVLFGVLKAGACYIPIDLDASNYDHILETLRLVQPKLLIIPDQEVYEDFPTLTWTVHTEQSPRTPQLVPRIPLESLAYIVFTSGTTSRRKGVMISHQALANYVQQGNPQAPFNMGVTWRDTVALIFSPGFDACTGVIFSTICNGGTLRVTNPAELELDLMACTILPATPSILSSIRTGVAYPRLRGIFLGGESPPPSLIKLWASSSRELWNCYGPSETTCASLIGRLLPDEAVVLGIPMPNSEVLLLDSDLEETSEGEICLSGPGLARGYFENDEMTSQYFVYYQGRRIYRTGDFARREYIGLRYLGRRDNQIKNRGFLVNLELDVVPMLQTLAGVNSALAFQHDEMLIAVVTPAMLDGNELRSLLSASQNAYLVPDIIVAMDSVPTTVNGKADLTSLRRELDLRTAKMTPLSVSEDSGYGSDTSNEQIQLLQSVVADVLGLPASMVSGDDSFWNLGGNSLKAIAVLSRLRRSGHTLPFGELLRNSILRDLAAMLEIAEDSEESDSILDTQPLQMTEIQRRLLSDTAKNPILNYLLVSAEIAHSGVASIGQQLRSSFEQLVSRHKAFRLVYSMQDNTQAVSQVIDVLNWHEDMIDELEWSYQIESTKKEMIDLLEDADLTSPPTMFRLITITKKRSVLLWLVHHARVDGWSARILFTELHQLMDEGRLLKPPQFDHAIRVASRKTMCRKNLSGKRSTFTPKDLDLDMIKPLPYQPARAPRSWYHTSKAERQLSFTVEDLERSAQKVGVTGSTMLYAAWALLLTRYTDSPTVAFGTVSSGRNHPVPGSAYVVGPMIQLLPLVFCISRSGTKSAFLNALHSHFVQLNNLDWGTLEAESHHSSIIGRLDTIVALQYDLPPLSQCQALPGSWKIDFEQITEYTWTLLIEEKDEKLCLQLLYDNRVVSKANSYCALKHFENLLEQLLDPVDGGIATTTSYMLRNEELTSLVQNQSLSSYTYQGPNSLKEAFEAASDMYPTTTALKTPEKDISYHELDNVTNQIAASLAAQVSPGEVVAVLGDGSMEWIFAILAVLKAGAVYCTIDSQSSRGHITAVLEASKSNILISSQKLPDALVNEPLPCSTISVTSLFHDARCNTQRLASRAGLQDIAYMVCSSGTVSRPKAICHRNLSLLSYLANEPARAHASVGTKLAQTFSAAFDACAAEIFGAFCYGATLVLKHPEDPLWNLRRATAAIIVPSFLGKLNSSEFSNLRVIMVGGEVASQPLVDSWSESRIFYNGYGPCECSVACLISHEQPGHSVTLGRPVPGMCVYILDSNGDPMPVGLPGDLWASGVQVADGYAMCGPGDDASFKPDPFQPGFTMFKTGDIARWTPNMEVEYVGRLDRQAKVRGYRVNLEDVETALRHSSPLITHAAILQSNDSLVAFVAPDTADLGAIRENLSQSLPGYMRPSLVKALKTMPQTLNQKIDYRALNQIKSSMREPLSSGTIPVDPVSVAIANVWVKALEQPLSKEHGPFMESDFLELGGHSLLQIAVSRDLSSHFGHKIPLRLVMMNSVLSELSQAVEKELSNENINATPFLNMEPSDEIRSHELSSQESQLIASSNPAGSSRVFNCALLISIEGILDSGALINSLDEVVRNHRVLRSRYEFDGRSVKRIISAVRDLVHMSAMPQLDSKYLEQETNRQFDLATEQPVRMSIVRTRRDKHYIILVAHHCVADETTMCELLLLIQRSYTQLVLGEPRSAPVEQHHHHLDYLDWIQWRKTFDFTKSFEYWKTNLQGAQPLFGRPQETTPNLVACTLTSKIPQTLATLISRYHDTHSVSMHDILLTGAVIAMNQVYGVSDVLAAIPFSDRLEPGTEHMLGCFLDYVHIRVNVENDSKESVNSTLAAVQASRQSAISNYVPSTTVLEVVSATVPLFDLMLSYHPEPDGFKFDIPGCTTHIRRLKANGSKFPIMIEVFNREEGMIFDVEFDTELISQSNVETLRISFIDGLERICSSKDLRDSEKIGSS